MNNNKIILTSKNSNFPNFPNFYVFCAIYFPKFDLFDCVITKNNVIKHTGGTYSGTQKKIWENPGVYYNIFSNLERKRFFYETYTKVFGTHLGLKKIFQKVSKFELDYISFHASIMLMRKKGIIPLKFIFLDYEELSGHYQIGLQIQTLMFKKNGEFIEIDLNSVSADVLLSDYQKREYTLLDNEIDDNCIISGKDIIKKLSDGSLDNFAFSHRTIVREILQKK